MGTTVRRMQWAAVRRGALILAALAMWPVGLVGAESYEAPASRQAADVLDQSMLQGPHHRVNELIQVDGFWNVYSVSSDFGEFTVRGDAMLRRLLREITAIAVLRERYTITVTGEGALKLLVDPLSALHRLATQPVDTLAGIPLGAKRWLESKATGLSRERSPYEDTDLKTLFTVAAYKRKIAFSHGVDPYSRNGVLQHELDRVAWAHTAGYVTTFAIILVPVPNPLPLALMSLNTVELLNDVLERMGPEELFQLNQRELKDMGIPGPLSLAFLSHPAYSPRHQTVMTFSLKTLDGVARREQFVRAALEAATEEDALRFQQIAELLRGYHQKTGRLKALTTIEGVPVGLAESRTVFMGLPADHVQWTERVEQIVQRLKLQPGVGRQVRRYEVWLTGTLSPRARQELLARGIAPRELVGREVELLD